METKEFKMIKDLTGKEVKINKPTGTEYNTDSYEILKDSSRLLYTTTQLDIANGLWHYEYYDFDIPIRCLVDNDMLYVFGLNLADLSEEDAIYLKNAINNDFKSKYEY